MPYPTLPHIQTADLQKGDWVLLANGWPAKLMDGRKHTPTPICEVHGYFTEAGSVYAHDISCRVEVVEDGQDIPILIKGRVFEHEEYLFFAPDTGDIDLVKLTGIIDLTPKQLKFRREVNEF